MIFSKDPSSDDGGFNWLIVLYIGLGVLGLILLLLLALFIYKRVKARREQQNASQISYGEIHD